MQLVCAMCGTSCTLEEPARGKKPRTFAGCASCGHLNRVPRPRATEVEDGSAQRISIARQAAGRPVTGSTQPGLGDVSATDLLSRATPQAPLVAATPPPSRARVSVPPVPATGEAMTASAGLLGSEPPPARGAQTRSSNPPPVAPAKMRLRIGDAIEEDESDENERDDDAVESDAPAKHTRSAATAARLPPARTRGLVVSLLAAAAALAAAYVAYAHKADRAAADAHPATSFEGLLDESEHALDEGDTTLAAARVSQADTLGKSARALLDHARVDALVADDAWLRARLVAALGAHVTADATADTARRSADAAFNAAPNDPAAARAKLDALRITGDLDAARALVARLAPIGEQPETAYVTAALELAEDAPLSLGAVARLREAVASGRQPTRARSAFAYALARSGDFQGARHEINALAAKGSSAALVDELRAFVARSEHGNQPTAAATASPSTVATAAPLAANTVLAPSMPLVATAVAPTVPLAATARVPPSTPASSATAATPKLGSVTMEAALAAKKAGDVPRATAMYRALLDASPRDVEVVTALGDLARARGDGREAVGFYRRALTLNASFFPAMLGLADTLWDAGEHTAAQQRYTEIANRFSPAMYPGYVRQRLAPDAPDASPR